MGGIETIIPPDGPRLVQVRAPLYPSIETVVCGVEVAAASVNMLSFGQASDIAYTDVPDAEFLEVYLHPNTFIEPTLHQHETTQYNSNINTISIYVTVGLYYITFYLQQVACTTYCLIAEIMMLLPVYTLYLLCELNVLNNQCAYYV